MRRKLSCEHGRNREKTFPHSFIIMFARYVERDAVSACKLLNKFMLGKEMDSNDDRKINECSLRFWQDGL
jgi:hypothetical protein